jgi:VanZ family protein
MLERFRGLARGLVSDEGAIYRTCVEFFNAFVNLLPVYKDTPEIHIIIFKFFCDFTEYQSQYLSDEEPLQLFNAAIELFKKYSALNLGKVKLKSLEDEKEAYKDIFSMLKLLCILSGFSNDFNEVQEIIFIGLSILLPMITEELLEVTQLFNYL